MLTVLINNKPVRFELDCGAKFTLILQDYFNSLNINVRVEHPDIQFCDYNKKPIAVLGLAMVTVQFNNHSIKEKLYIVSPGKALILGRSWIRALNIELKDADPVPVMSICPPVPVNAVDISADNIIQ